MALTLPGIRSLFDRGGGRMYAGEPVTQLEHALQTAHSAERAGADAALITAALLHDLGHLLNDQGETPTARGIDDVHQYAALPFLRPLFDDEVLEPIRLHVDAKRYLCATEAAYFDRLSPGSRHTLRLQGGVMSADGAARFARHRWAADAVALRRWDDEAKVVGKSTRTLGEWAPLVRRGVSR